MMPLYAGPQQLGVYTTIFRLIGADMNSTADQVFVAAFPFSTYSIREINAVNASTAITAAVGGIYSGASKSGTALVDVDHSWALLSSSTRMDTPSLDPSANDTRTSAPFLSLTTAQGAPATVDFFIMGVAG
jgi:hypothetical protein